jgi:hypothetical protein
MTSLTPARSNSPRLMRLRAKSTISSRSTHVFGCSLNRSDHAMHGYSVFKARRCSGTIAQVARHSPIDASNIAWRHIFGPAGAVEQS